jgi:hypothetical protein
MSEDIVARLREEGFVTHMARLPRESKILHEAADEIERLRTVVQGWENSARNAERDIAELRAERDEARRLWCVDIGELYSSSSLSLAKERGWDCFKEKP